MSGGNQAYAGFGTREAGADEYNRLDFVVRSIMNKMATMTLVQVKAVNGQTVDIQPLVTQMDGAGNKVDHGVIHNAPVFRLQGGGGAFVLTPKVNDVGLAIFAHSDISKVKATGKSGLPGSRRKFDWADAIYLGGILNPNPTSFVSILPTGEINITAAGGYVRITSDQLIRLISDAGTQTSGPFSAGNGATGTYKSQDGKTITVINGITTGIV